MTREQDGAGGGLLQGTLDLLVLRVLVAGALHGYAISRRLTDLSGGWLSVDEGSLYPCLYRMGKRGWIRAEAGRSEKKRKARFYFLTYPGGAALEGGERAWQ